MAQQYSSEMSTNNIEVQQTNIKYPHKNVSRHYHSISDVPVDDKLSEKLEKISSFNDLLAEEKQKMSILIVGSGGREFAIALKLTQQDSDKILDIYYTGPSPNAGLDDLCINKCISPKTCNNDTILECVRKWNIHLVIVGPEQPLESGICDVLHDAGILCFGPKSKSAQIETSKGFARKLMYNCNLREYCPKFIIVTPQNRTEYNTFVSELNGHFVVKPDGPQGGKGVKVSGDHFKTIDEGISYIEEILDNGQSVVVEEKLFGEEFSFMTFTDGISVKHTIPIKDYKRAYDNDLGPNTGSMGCVTGPNGMLWFLTEDDIRLAKQINELVILYLQEHTHELYQGVIYGSFIKTKDGLKVIEYNARFGDPECVNLLTLLNSNLYDILLAVASQSLSSLDNIEFSPCASVFKYLVPLGYPNKPVKNEIVSFNPNHFTNDKKTTLIYGNISKSHENSYIELGSRTLGMICINDSIQEAAQNVNRNFEKLDIDKKSLINHPLQYKEIRGPLFYRKDIGYLLHKLSDETAKVLDMQEQNGSGGEISPIVSDAYAKAGVNIDEGNRVVKEIRSAVESTFTPLVCSEFGDFAGMIRVPKNTYCDDPYVLVASTDGVGTKSILVLETFGPEIGYEMLGNDIVNHCINDVLVKGARPYLFLDYFGAHTIKAEHVKYFVQGVAKACKKVGCALLGGETAEMPAVYQNGHSEVSGTMVGIVKQSEIINGKQQIKEGDIVLGIPSSGPHTNGYTLIRKLVKEHNTPKDMMEKLCATHRSYLDDFEDMINVGTKIHGLCHLTGGGFAENPKRILPSGLDIKYEPFEYSDVFKYLQNIGNIPDQEMRKIFNCGIGMMVFVSPDDVNSLQEWRAINGKLPYYMLGRVYSTM